MRSAGRAGRNHHLNNMNNIWAYLSASLTVAEFLWFLVNLVMFSSFLIISHSNLCVLRGSSRFMFFTRPVLGGNQAAERQRLYFNSRGSCWVMLSSSLAQRQRNVLYTLDRESKATKRFISSPTVLYLIVSDCTCLRLSSVLFEVFHNSFTSTSSLQRLWWEILANCRDCHGMSDTSRHLFAAVPHGLGRRPSLTSPWEPQLTESETSQTSLPWLFLDMFFWMSFFTGWTRAVFLSQGLVKEKSTVEIFARRSHAVGRSVAWRQPGWSVWCWYSKHRVWNQ